MAKEVKPKQRSTLKPSKKKLHTRNECLTLAQKLCKLRELKEYGKIWCISCGKSLEYGDPRCNGGHYISRQDRATETEPDNLWPQCNVCLTPDALILMADFTWKNLGDIEEGEKLFAFEEYADEQTYRRYKVATVTHVHKSVADIFEVEFTNGDKVKTTAEHMWLGRHGKNGSYKWIETKKLWVDSKNLEGHRISGNGHEHTYSTLCKVINVVEKDNSWEAGWMAGMIDADGHVTQQVGRDIRCEGIHSWGFRIGIAQSDTYPHICKQIVDVAEKLTGRKVTVQEQPINRSKLVKKTNVKTFQYLINGSNMQKLEFLQMVRPNKISKVNIGKLGKVRCLYDSQVKSITPLGKSEIIVMETDTRTFIANGYAMHNCNVLMRGNIPMYRYHLVKLIGAGRVARLDLMSLARKGNEEALDALTPEDRMLATMKKSARYYDCLYYELKQQIKDTEKEIEDEHNRADSI